MLEIMRVYFNNCLTCCPFTNITRFPLSLVSMLPIHATMFSCDIESHIKFDLETTFDKIFKSHKKLKLADKIVNEKQI